MCEPLSVGVHACRRANIGPETNVLVMGAGPIGLVTMMAARAFGAPRIVIVDVDDYRLSVAKDLGADEVVKVSIDIQVSVFFISIENAPSFHNTNTLSNSGLSRELSGNKAKPKVTQTLTKLQACQNA